jgi:hypothetical protein
MLWGCMNPQILTAEQLIGIREKLGRAKENIGNLKSEIDAFLNERPNGSIGDDNRNAAEDLLKWWNTRKVPPRFGVLAGEVVHHLRSCLDHIAWALSSESYRRSHARNIAFPVVTKKQPWDKDTTAGYERQIKGITDIGALTLIAEFQPYHAVEPADRPIAIVHDLNRVDKHRNVVLVIQSYNARSTIPIPGSLVIGAHADVEINRAVLAEKVYFQFSPYIAFGQFGTREKQEVVESLSHLFDAISGVVNLFAGDCK